MRQVNRLPWRLYAPLTLLASLLCGFDSCAPPQAPGELVLNVMLTAKDELGGPVPGAEFATSTSALGHTDEHGRLLVSLRGRESARVAISTVCPAGSHFDGEPLNLPLRNIGGGANGSARSVEVGVVCTADTRKAALVINTNGRAGLPILVQGVERARTGPDGVAHLLLQLEPKEEVQITLDTHATPGLIPQQPSRVFAMGHADSLFLFDQAFREPAPAVVRKKRRAPPKEEPLASPPEDAAPYRLN